MKKKIIIPSLLLLHAAMAAAQYSIEAKPFTTLPGIVADDAAYMEICINYGAEEQANMAQFNISLPEGMTLDEESGAFELDETRFPEYKVGRQTVQPFSVSSASQADGTTLVAITTMQDYWFQGNTGTALRIYYLTDSEMPLGEYEVKIDRGVIAIPAAEGNGPSGLSSITKVIVGDPVGIRSANASGKASVKDAYTADGRRRSATTKGLNIVKMSDGTVKKVIKR